MSSTMSPPDQARDESLSLKTLPQNEKSPSDQNFLSSPFPYMQVCSNHFNMIPADVLFPEPKPLCAIPAEGFPEGYFSQVTSSDAAKFYKRTPNPKAYCYSRIPMNPLPNHLNNLFTINDSEMNSPLSISYTMETEVGSGPEKASCPVQDDKVGKGAIVPASYAYDEGEEEIVEADMKVVIHSEESKTRAATTERLRRAKIAEGIKALKDSIPWSGEGNKGMVLDDVIDYIKFLKLQLKALSQIRLNGEATPVPFVYIEGYGHYLFHEQLCGEPLEELIGHLMESDMQAATELLESKGLTMLPMPLAYTLLQTS